MVIIKLRLLEARKKKEAITYRQHQQLISAKNTADKLVRHLQQIESEIWEGLWGEDKAVSDISAYVDEALNHAEHAQSILLTLLGKGNES